MPLIMEVLSSEDSNVFKFELHVHYENMSNLIVDYLRSLRCQVYDLGLET